MPTESEKIIAAQLKKIPNDVRELLLSPDFEKNINLIRTRHDIPINKETTIQNEILLLIIGFSEPEEFQDILTQSLNIPREEAGLIIRDIDRFILAPIKSSLVAFFNSERNKPETAATQKIRTGSLISENSSKIETPKHQPHSNLPVVEPHLEPMIISGQESFLPPLRKNIPPISQPVAPTPSVSTPPVPKIPPQTPVTPIQADIKTKNMEAMKSALSAEIGSLLNGIQSEIKTPEKPQVTVASKPEDKMSAITESPRIEVHMEKTPTNSSNKKSEDPYREPI